MLTVKTQVDLDKYRERLALGGPVQTALDRMIVDYAIPYCPFKTGTLSRSPYAVSDFGSGEIVYPGPYAHYQYMGEVYGPNIPVIDSKTGDILHYFSIPCRRKQPTGRALQYNQSLNPLAGPFWIERMKADKMPEIIEAVKKLATE